jgi:hypothetical protein
MLPRKVISKLIHPPQMTLNHFKSLGKKAELDPAKNANNILYACRSRMVV